MISIILPIYQVEDYIGNSIESICKQSYEDFEVILVNDGTLDNSINIAEKLLKKKSITYEVINQKNQGVSAARNNGIKKARGEWVVCIDPDDVINEHFLSVLNETIVNNQTEVAIGSFQMVNKDNIFKEPKTKLKISTYKRDEILESFLIRNIKVISPSMLVRRDFLIKNNIWYDEKMFFSEDIQWIWKVLLNTNEISYVHAEIYNYNLRDNSTMTSSNIDKIMTGYYGFKNIDILLNDYNFEMGEKFLLNRWVIGALRASTRMLNYDNFSTLADSMDYKKHLQKLFFFPDFRIKVLTTILQTNKKLFYFVCKYI